MIKSKSTANNINHILDVGTPFSIFESYINSYHQYIDFIKFGWGSVLIDNEFPSKKKALRKLWHKTPFRRYFF